MLKPCTIETIEITRVIQTYYEELVKGLGEDEIKSMALSLSHGMSRFKLSFSPEKVDQMVVQAVGLLDDIDKESNTFCMRLKEWYGWHFPEVVRILPDSQLYAEFVLMVGDRSNCQEIGQELEALVGEAAQELREAAQHSMGSVLTETDLNKIKEVAKSVIELMEYRAELAKYLKVRMEAIAPNLTVMVGELVASRLIAHAGSLMNLSKHPASTVQILGAEKALFRALKQKKATPKYGIIYHVAVLGQASPQVKGSLSRCLAAKLALCARYDAFGAKSGDAATIGIEAKTFVENRLNHLQTELASGQSRKRLNTPSYANNRSTAFNKKPKY